MARNGAGVYSLPAGNPVVTGTTITATWANTTLTDLGTALTNSIAVDGQSVITANIPFGGFKPTGLASASAAGEALTYGQALVGTTGTFSGNVAVTGQISATSASISGAISGVSGAFTSSLTAPTLTAGDSSNNVATTAFVAAQAFTSALPGINTNTKGKPITNNGVSASWDDLTLSAQSFFFAQF